MSAEFETAGKEAAKLMSNRKDPRPFNGELEMKDLLKRLDDPLQDKLVVSNLIVALQIATMNQTIGNVAGAFHQLLQNNQNNGSLITRAEGGRLLG